MLRDKYLTVGKLRSPGSEREKPQTVLSQYRGLWQVEAAFRVAKHDLATRPIFHWTPKRIRTHVLLCFLALVLERHLAVRLKKRGTPLTTISLIEMFAGESPSI